MAQLIAAPIGLTVLAVLLTRELPLQRIHDHALGVATGVTVGLVGLEVFGYRLGVVARLVGLRVRAAKVWRVHVVTMFYYFFLPAGVGYDLVRAVKIGNASEGATGIKLAALASVERVAGGAGLVVLLVLALPFTKVAEDARLDWIDPPVELWLSAVAALAATAAVLYILGQSRYPRLRLIYPAAAVSAGAYAIVGGGLWIAADALGIRVSSTEILVALAGTLLFQLIPVNLIGVSFGEVAGVAIYMAYGLDRPDAVFLVTIAYLQRLAAAVLGGGVEAVHSARWLVANGNDGRVGHEEPYSR